MTGTTRDDLYRYAATIVRFIDGDTFEGSVALGCRVWWHGSVRCAGYNTPEVYGPTKAEGLASAAYVRTLAPPGSTVYLNSLAFSAGAGNEMDSFGRMLAVVTLPDGRDLAETMIAGGYGIPYNP